MSFPRDGLDWVLCHDPGPPALLRGDDAAPDEYQWNHSIVAYWSSHLDPSDGVMWDVHVAAQLMGIQMPKKSKKDKYRKKHADLEQIIVPTPTVGPMRTNLDKIAAQLSAVGIQTCEIRAPYDTLCWPKATHGFFRFKENIPKFIETLRLK